MKMYDTHLYNGSEKLLPYSFNVSIFNKFINFNSNVFAVISLFCIHDGDIVMHMNN